MKEKKDLSLNLTVTILSFSLLTVMAGAAVAPALKVIQDYFYDTPQSLVQMIISIPALFIFLTNMVFPRLCELFRAKELMLAGLIIYVVGGCAAGLFDNIWIILLFRAIVGAGVGIIMPMSTGLLSYYYPKDKQDKLMGYSSAMNQMGGVIATLVSGLLAEISWRASFLVYLMGLLCTVLCLLFLPNEKIGSQEKGKEKGVFKKCYPFVIAMFLLMFTFFVYPSSFAMETARKGIISTKYISIIMAGMDLIAFLGGLAFAGVKRYIGMRTKYIAPLLFLMGYLALLLLGGWPGAIIGSSFIGFANGLGIPLIMSAAGQSAGRAAATTVMPLISMALYLAQFTTPMILSAAGHAPYLIASCSSALLLVWSYLLKLPPVSKDTETPETKINH